MFKKIISLFMAFTIILSTAAPVSAATFGENGYENGIWNYYITSDNSTFDNVVSYLSFVNKYTKGETTKLTGENGVSLFFNSGDYFGSSSRGGSFQGDNNKGYVTQYESGTPSYQSIISESFNTTNNNYDYTFNYFDQSIDITEINYNNEYNLYELVTNETNYYITYSPTYVTVIYQDPVESYTVKSEIYYRLPDGRNSYDLTAEDVWGTYFIYNAVNYDEVVEDDGVTHRLYHLDGDFFDSSYFNVSATCSYYNFYEGKFEGSLYCNSTLSTSDLTISIPDDLLDTGYTVEFWVKPDSKTSIDVNVPAYLSSYPNITSTKSISGLNAGIWNHVVIYFKPLVKSSSTYSYIYVTFYVNGVDVTSKQSWSYLSIDSNYVDLWTHIWSFNCEYSGYEYYLDEIRISKGEIYTSNFVIPSQPFDTNLVLVQPDSGNENDIAIKSNVAVSGFRVGGVRPTYPTNGYTYVYLENDVVKDVQQYQTDGWYSVEASIYEEGKWSNLYNKDLSDIAITEEDFTTTNPTPTPDGGDSSGGSGDSSGGDTGEEDTTESILSKIVNTLLDFVNGILNTIFGGILDLITTVTTNLTGLIESFSGITGLIGALFGFLPEPMVNVLTAGLAVALLVLIIKVFI